MPPLNDCVIEYTQQLSKGKIQKAYKGIMTFMSELKNYMVSKHPEYSASALYFGYMDMTYFAFTPMELKNRSLKIAVVYLHEQNRFEVWLSGSNRGVQAEYIELLNNRDTHGYKVSRVSPGIDSIIEATLIENPNFDFTDSLMQEIEVKTIEFSDNIISIFREPS